MSMAKMTLSRDARDFVNDDEIEQLIAGPRPDQHELDDILAKSMSKQFLTAPETATLARADDPESVERIFAGARQLKRDVYGNRIVIFAPLYIGNDCVNDCLYCAFRRSNQDVTRRTLDHDTIVQQVRALEDKGHKRLILVFGEHPAYDADFIHDSIQTVYATQSAKSGAIRRVNINAAPLDVAGYKRVKDAGIGTYQVFQETYHHATYRTVHPPNTRKGDYLYRLDALYRAQEAGIDDVGLGVLYGLYDWRFETVAMVQHALDMQQRCGVGPHTLSFPRIRPAHGVDGNAFRYPVSDYDFKRIIAILRLAVPYTGLILTAREPAALRRAVMEFGVSQIDAGSRIELGGYTEAGDAQQQFAEREQFELGDIRSLDQVMRELLVGGYIPSFCTACYRLGRTGEHFMEFAIPGFIQNFCTPNGLLTLSEYLLDYGSDETQAAGAQLIEQELGRLPDDKVKRMLVERLERMRTKGERDLYF
jgi:2-iminoacetate synthase